ncbi:MAG: GIY-YIG nuclease family protein [Saprospiraceae bacterium]|nr:GIY-YIG nuclease family protein [Saprospiraceae bacterium]
MNVFTYILYSTSLNRFYIGATNDLDSRLKKHNAPYEKVTKKGTPWIVIWATCKPTKASASI